MILSVIVGFIGWGIAVKWIPALRYLGYAFAAGVACAFALIGAAFVLTIRKDTGNRAYVTPPSRNVNFVAPDVWRGEITNLRKRLHYQRAPSSIQSLTIAEKLNAFLDLILRDFVTSWHSSISSDRLFENEVDKIIQGVVAEVQDRTAGLDLVEVVVARIVPLLTLHMKDFYEAERAVRGPNLERSVTELEELDIAIAGKYRNGTLHPAVSLSPLEKQRIQQDHLRAIIERILLQVMPATQTRSRAVVILVRDIITSFVVFPLQQMLTDPDMWNQLIEAYVCINLLIMSCLLSRRVRVAQCFKIGSQFARFALRLTSMHHLILSRAGDFVFQDWGYSPASAASRSSSAPLDGATVCPMLGCSGGRYLAN